MDAMTTLIGKLQKLPGTLAACRAIANGDHAVKPTVDMTNGRTIRGVPEVCLELQDTGFFSKQVFRDDDDIEVPEPCDSNMGKVSLLCFKACLWLAEVVSPPNQTLDEWRNQADKCAESCRIGCDGHAGPGVPWLAIQ